MDAEARKNIVLCNIGSTASKEKNKAEYENAIRRTTKIILLVTCALRMSILEIVVLIPKLDMACHHFVFRLVLS